MNIDDRLSIHVLEGDEPRSGESPTQYMARVHEGDACVLRLLALDRPEPSADFDESFLDRLTALRIIQHAEMLEADEPEVLDSRLDALLSSDRPLPSTGFDRTYRNRLRREMAADSGLRMPAADLLRVPSLPKHDSPMFQRLRQGSPFTRRKFAVVAVMAAASLIVTFWFAQQEQALQPPDEELAMVAHLDLLENYEEVEVFEALRDEDVFDVVASLDSLAVDDDAEPGAGRVLEMKTQ